MEITDRLHAPTTLSQHTILGTEQYRVLMGLMESSRTWPRRQNLTAPTENRTPFVKR